MSIKHILGDVAKKDTVYVHSVPASAQIYDSIWSELAGLSLEYTNDRVPRLSKLLAPTYFHKKKQIAPFSPDAIVLDVCAGHGAYSIAALEMGAQTVYVCDGSYAMLHKQTQKLKHTPPLYENFNDRLIRVQADVEKIDEVFTKESFDLVFQRYAIHHVRNPFKTAYHMARLVKPGGRLSFNFFITGCTPPVSRDLRRHFLKRDFEYVRSFLMPLGVVNKVSREIDISDVLSGKINMSPLFHETITYLKKLCEIYGSDAVVSRIHYEDLTTPYLHNIDPHMFYRFLTKEVGLNIEDGLVGTDEASMTFQVPAGGIRTPIIFPDPAIYSSEDINLGDELIKNTEIKNRQM